MCGNKYYNYRHVPAHTGSTTQIGLSKLETTHESFFVITSTSLSDYVDRIFILLFICNFVRTKDSSLLFPHGMRHVNGRHCESSSQHNTTSSEHQLRRFQPLSTSFNHAINEQRSASAQSTRTTWIRPFFQPLPSQHPSPPINPNNHLRFQRFLA